MTAEKPTPDDEPSSGTISLDGYFYQRDTSVWAALELILARQLAREVVLEPITEEDMEASLEDEPDALAGRLATSSYVLVVQCKLKTTGPWDATGINRVLSHGKRRTKPKDRLKEPGIRYLLVTNADAQGVARDIIVDDIGVWREKIPPSIQDGLPHDAVGRLAVLVRMDAEKLASRTQRLLTERFHVPVANLEPCLKELRDASLARMLNQNGGRWTFGDLETSIRTHGGYVGSSAALDGYVKPGNWEELRQKLRDQHAVIIAGPSGTGKTRTASALVAELIEGRPGLRHVKVTGGPEKILSDSLPGDVVFEIEDPWGRYKLAGDALAWSEQLEEILRTASAARVFVITTRTDIFRASKTRTLRERWFMELVEENYGPKERDELFEQNLRDLPRDLQPLALAHRAEAVAQLGSPLELVRFFDTMLDGAQPGESDPEFAHRCLATAHEDAIEAAISQGVTSRNAHREAALVWGLFKAYGRIDFEFVPAIQSNLGRLSPAYDDLLTPFLDFLVAGRNLRQNGSSLSYQHNRVEEGLERGMSDRPNLASRTLDDLVRVLAKPASKLQSDVGPAGVARIVDAAGRIDTLHLSLDGDVQAKVDDWLRELLADPGDDLQDNLRLAAKVGSEASNVALLARWLTNVQGSGDLLEWTTWSEASHEADWYERLAADPLTKSICAAFIRRIPYQHLSLPDDFADAIRKFSPDLTPTFIETAKEVIYHGFNPHLDVIFEGALQDLDSFAEVVREADEYLEKSRSDSDRNWLALRNGEFHEEAAEHYYESAGEEGYAALAALEAYVAKLRALKGWEAVDASPLRKQLATAWFDILRRVESAVSEDEWKAAARLANGAHSEWRFWDAMRSPHPLKYDLLRNRLSSTLGNVRTGAAVAGAASRVASHALADAMEQLLGDRKFDQAFELAASIRQSGREEDSDKEWGNVADTARAANAAAGEVIDAIIWALPAKLGTDAMDLMRSISSNFRELQVVRARALAASGEDVSATLLGLIDGQGDTDEDINTATMATAVAASLSLDSLLRQALGHRFARVREEALVGLSAVHPDRLPSELREMASDKSHFVTQTLVGILATRPAELHEDVLVQLAGDDWNKGFRQYGEPANYPIARAAAEHIATLARIDGETFESLAKIVVKTEDRTVKRKLLEAMARSGTDAGRARIVALACRTGQPPLHLIATNALLSAVDKLSTSLIGQIASAHVLQSPAPVAARLAVLVGAGGEEAQVLSLSADLSPNQDRRALLIMLARGVMPRSNILAQKILSQFTEPVPTEVFAALSGTGQLRVETLRSLGDIRTTEAIRQILKDYIATEPPAAPTVHRRKTKTT